MIPGELRHFSTGDFYGYLFQGSTPFVHGRGVEHALGALLLMCCLVQGMGTSKPSVAHKPEEDLRQVQEKSIPATIGWPKALTFMECRGRQYNEVLIKRHGDQAWNSRKG